MTGRSKPPSKLDNVRAARERESSFYEAVLKRGAVVAWGDEGGLLPWEDDDGDVLVPLWPDVGSAAGENEGQSDDGEAAVLISLDAPSRKLRDWISHEVDAVAIHPVGGQIAATLTIPDFARRLLAADAALERRLPREVRAQFQRYVPRLP